MAVVELTGVPFDGYGRPGNQAGAAAVLRDEGFVSAFAGHRMVDHGDLVLPPPTPSRGPTTTLVNEPALLTQVDALRDRVAAARRRGAFTVLFGGDCTTLLGTVPGLQDAGGPTGLVFVDGHEDATPLDVSEDGEAANAEIGLLMGLTGRTHAGPLRHATAPLEPALLSMLGQRDHAWRQRFNVGTLRDLGAWGRAATEVSADPGRAATEALGHLVRSTDTWWLHTDLDVLDPEEFAAQGLPDAPDDPGGLSWSQLHDLVATALTHPGCCGWSVAIYDPDQDPDRTHAQRVVELARAVSALLPTA